MSIRICTAGLEARESIQIKGGTFDFDTFSSSCYIGKLFKQMKHRVEERRKRGVEDRIPAIEHIIDGMEIGHRERKTKTVRKKTFR